MLKKVLIHWSLHQKLYQTVTMKPHPPSIDIYGFPKVTHGMPCRSKKTTIAGHNLDGHSPKYLVG